MIQKAGHGILSALQWLSEGYHTFSVTTLHPIGWGMQKVRRGLLRGAPGARAILSEHEHPVLLVHGIFHNGTAFYQLEKALRRNNFQTVQTVELWTALNSMVSMANQLKKEALEALTRADAGKRFARSPLKLRLVAHSLGGMVTRIALLDPVFAASVDKVIFLCTPHQGSRYFAAPFPACLAEIKGNSSILRRLREEPLPGGIRYFNLRGELDVVTPASSTFLPTVPNYSYPGVGHAGLLSNPMVVQSVVEILESPFYDSTPEIDVG